MRSLAIMALCFWLSVPTSAQNVRIVHIDVGQGSATLVVGPTGTACLIDGGPSGTGYGAVVPTLIAEGVTFLDYVVLSHYHSDHWRGITEVVGSGYGIGTAYDRGTANQPGGISSYLGAVSGVRQTIAPGTVIDLGGGATLTCIVVNGQVLGGGFSDPTTGNQEENSRSIGLRLDYGGFQEAICGDLTGGGNTTANVESTAASVMGDVDVMVLSHHGSNTSTNLAWVNDLDAEIGVISVGVNSPYGHPHWEPISRFFSNSNSVQLYRLNQGSSNLGGLVVNGSFKVVTDGGVYTMSGPTIPTVTLPVDSGGPPMPGPSPALLPGDVVIAEYMNNPSAVSDSDGEWIELVNTTASPVDLQGFTIRDQDFDSFIIATPLVVPGRGNVVLAANGITGQNGGVTADFVWPSGSMFLANGADEIEVVSVEGTVLDAIAYDGGPVWPDPTGRSVERIDLKALPYATNFTTATTSFGAGDDGTPGAVNSTDATGPWISLTPSAPFTIGTTVGLALDAGFARAGAGYVLVLSECAIPGVEFQPSGRVIDVCPTALANFVLTTPNAPGLYSGFGGNLGSFGAVTAFISVPNLPSFSGLTFYLSGVVLDGSAPEGLWIVDNLRADVN